MKSKTYEKILARIVLILILVLVSKLDIERKKFSFSNTRLEEIRALVSKHEIDRNKFLFSKDEIGFSLVTDPQLHAGFRTAFERPSEDLPCPSQGPRVH